MKKPLTVPWISLILFATFVSCVKKAPPPVVSCEGVTPKTYSIDVNPIIQTYCNQPDCHQPGSVNGPGSLTNFNEVYNARQAIREAVSSGLMPQNGPLTPAQKQAIVCWIDNGAVNN